MMSGRTRWRLVALIGFVEVAVAFGFRREGLESSISEWGWPRELEGLVGTNEVEARFKVVEDEGS